MHLRSSIHCFGFFLSFLFSYSNSQNPCMGQHSNRYAIHAGSMSDEGGSVALVSNSVEWPGESPTELLAGISGRSGCLRQDRYRTWSAPHRGGHNQHRGSSTNSVWDQGGISQDNSDTSHQNHGRTLKQDYTIACTRASPCCQSSPSPCSDVTLGGNGMPWLGMMWPRRCI